MYCKDCGAKIDAAERSCPVCGVETLNAEDVQSSDSFEFVPLSGNAAELGKFKKIIGNKEIGIIAVAAVLIVVAVILIMILGGGSPEKAAVEYREAFYEGNYSKMCKNCAYDMDKFMDASLSSVLYFSGYQDVNEYLKDECNAESVEEYCDICFKNILENYEDEYGEDFKASIKAVDSEKLDDDEKADVIESNEMTVSSLVAHSDYAEKDILDTDKIKKIEKVSIKIKIEGSESNYTTESDLYVAKIGSNWLVLKCEMW